MLFSSVIPWKTKPEVLINENRVIVKITDHVLGRPLQIEADLLSLASAVIPNKDEALAQFFKVPLNDDGFFVEKHAKLGPSEFATDGVFLCGLAHYPKPIDESIAQGKAAASRAITLLSRQTIFTSGTVAATSPADCSSCGVCISICPYQRTFIYEKVTLFPARPRSIRFCVKAAACVSLPAGPVPSS